MKLVSFHKIFSKKLCVPLFGVLFVACSSEKLPDSNKTFNEKYAVEVQKIKAVRVEQISSKSQERMNFNAPLDQDLSRYTNNNVTVPEYYTTRQFANQVLNDPGFNSQIEMFENSYNPSIRTPFRKIGAEFDAIDIPSKDAYGVNSGMSDKEYLLVSRKLLQKNVDQINVERSGNDIKNSEILIEEGREIKRKERMKNIFGRDSIELDESRQKNKSADFGDKSGEDDSKKKKVVKRSKPLNAKDTPQVVQQKTLGFFNQLSAPANKNANPPIVVPPSAPTNKQ